MKGGLRVVGIVALALVAMRSTGHASLLFLYDFPGGGSGLASSQTNSQPSNATFGDFTRTNVTYFPGADPNSFSSKNWALGGSVDVTKFEGFSITAAGGYHLNLSSLTFDAVRNPTGPKNALVALFINGSATAYATYSFSPTTSNTAYTFNFTPLTDANNVTTATFNFYGWNATGTGGQLALDNVATFGDISNLPESSALSPILALVGCVLITRRRAKSLRERSASYRLSH